MADGVKLHESWKAALGTEFASPYMAELKSFLLAEREAGKRIFPAGSEWFRALDLTPLDQVRIVILGQDPYHGAGAWPLLFSAAGCPAAAEPGQHFQGAEKRPRH